MKYFSGDVGRGIKSTVHEYRWEFTIEETDVCIQLFIYLISNIRKVIYNQEVLKEEHPGPNNTYSYEFIMDGHHYRIVQAMDSLTQLFIDGESFDYNYTLERNKKEFSGNNNGKVCDIYTKEDDDVIQASNEIEFIKREKPKQNLNLSFGIKNNKNSINKKQNNLNKFKFGSGENIQPKKIQNNQNINNSNINNLIDLDNDFINNNNSDSDFNNFNLNQQNIQYNNNIINQRNYNDLNNINLNNINLNYNDNINNNNNFQNDIFDNQNKNNFPNNFNNGNNYINNNFPLDSNNLQNNNNYENNFDMNNNNNFNMNKDMNYNNYNHYDKSYKTTLKYTKD